MKERKLKRLPTTAILLIFSTAWLVVAHFHYSFYNLTAPVYVIAMAAFGEWANGNEAITGWPKKRPPEK